MSLFLRLSLAVLACCLLTACASDGPTGPGSSAEPPGEAPPSFEELFGTVLLRADGSEEGLRAVQDKTLVGIFFASPSCPACQAFTPQLVSAYDQLLAEGKSFEIVMASFGSSSEEMLSFMRADGAGWLATPYDVVGALALAGRFGVEVVPTIVVLDSGRNVVTKTGREDVVAMGAAAWEHWLAESAGP